MKSRKLIALLLAAVMLIGTMTGCNQSTTTQAEVQNETENTTEENTETGVKKVKNLVIGTTTPNTTFNLYESIMLDLSVETGYMKQKTVLFSPTSLLPLIFRMMVVFWTLHGLPLLSGAMVSR